MTEGLDNVCMEKKGACFIGHLINGLEDISVSFKI
jgi:hypothetical protein